MQLPTDKELQWYDRHGKPRPSHEEHGVSDTFENPLSGRLLKGNPRNWHLKGNVLTCDTDFGPFAQTIPANLILTGVDEQGLPVFKEL